MSRFGQCPICQEHFTSPSEISVVSCGHTFHQHCILQWLERQRQSRAGGTCPQCRQPVSEKTLVRQIFFDQSGEPDSQSNDGMSDAELRIKILNLQAQITTNDAELKNLREILARKETEEKQKENELKRLRSQVERLEGSLSTLRSQLVILENVKEEKRVAEDKVKKYKNQLKIYSTYDALLSGTAAKARESISKQDAEALPQLLEVLKSQYDKIRKDKEELAAKNSSLSSSKRKVEAEYASSRKLIETLREEIKVVRGENMSPYNPQLRSFLEKSAVESPLAGDECSSSGSSQTLAIYRKISAIPGRAKNPDLIQDLTTENSPMKVAKMMDLDEMPDLDSPNVVLPGGISTRMVGILTARPKNVPSDGLGGRSRPTCAGMKRHNPNIHSGTSKGKKIQKAKSGKRLDSKQSSLSMFQPKLLMGKIDDDVVVIDDEVIDL